jgi:hypothetical protein
MPCTVSSSVRKPRAWPDPPANIRLTSIERARFLSASVIGNLPLKDHDREVGLRMCRIIRTLSMRPGNCPCMVSVLLEMSLSRT